MQKERVKVKRLAFAPTTKRSIDISEQRRGVEYWFHRLCNESHWPGSWLTGCENISPRPIRTKTEIHFLLPPRNRSQSLHNPLHPSRTRMLSTILDRVPPSLELEKNPSRILWKKASELFFENTVCFSNVIPRVRLFSVCLFHSQMRSEDTSEDKVLSCFY